MTAARTQAAPAGTVTAAIRAHLEAERQRVRASIRAYPAPITACDAQFNHLLEQRAALSAELQRLDALAAAGPPDEGALEAFLADSTCIDAETAARLRNGSA